MDWNKGFSAKYYATFIDPVTWRDIERFNITGGSVKRSDSGLLNSADIDCIDYQQEKERWIRVYLDTRQEGSSAHVPLFTGLATAPHRDIDGVLVSNSLECYSVLQPAQDVLLQPGYYAQAGENGASIVRRLLTPVTPAPIEVDDNSPALANHIIAENGESHLSMATKILDAINWRLRIDGNGNIKICAKASKAVTIFDPIENDSIKPEIKAVNDWYACPNVYMAVYGGVSATARDDSETSPLSVRNRGREVWEQDLNVALNKNETVAQYAARKLKEKQQHFLAVSYERRFHPDVVASDLITLHYPKQKIDGTFYVSSQTITLGYGAETSEEAVQI